MTKINETTLALIGGNQTFAMCVATSNRKWISACDANNSVSFRYGRNKTRTNWVEFRYVAGKDPYEVSFSTAKFVGSCITEKRLLATFPEIYGDQLRGLFERFTGLRTSLTKVYA